VVASIFDIAVARMSRYSLPRKEAEFSDTPLLHMLITLHTGVCALPLGDHGPVHADGRW